MRRSDTRTLGKRIKNLLSTSSGEVAAGSSVSKTDLFASYHVPSSAVQALLQAKGPRKFTASTCVIVKILLGIL